MSEPFHPNQNFDSSSTDDLSAPVDMGKSHTGEPQQGQPTSTPPSGYGNPAYNPYVVPVTPGTQTATGRQKQNTLSTYLGVAALVSCLLGFLTFFTFFLAPVFGVPAVVFAIKEKKQGHNSTLGFALGCSTTGVSVAILLFFMFLMMALSTI